MKDTKVTEIQTSVLTLPTEDLLESDGTLEWNSTSLILVQISAGGRTGMGYTYGDPHLGEWVRRLGQAHVMGQNSLDIENIWVNLTRAVRNGGRQGSSAMAISALDIALWDLKCRLLQVSLVDLLGACREQVEVYGSGGFTSFTIDELQSQIRDWQRLGIRRFKIKVGSHPADDIARARFAKECIGPEGELMVDANEAYTLPQALEFAQEFARLGVRWFEQPVRSTDATGMRELRQKFPPGLQLATGEYIFDLSQVAQMVTQRSADVVQLDVTRCQGVTGFLKAASVCEAFNKPVSSHCAPALHASLACAVPGFTQVEYFFDHARFESMVFDGVPEVREGSLRPARASFGFGMTLKETGWQQWRQ